MADIKVSQMGEVLVASDNDLLNLVSYDEQNQTYVSGKVKASTLKSYMVDDLEVSDLYDTTITTPTDDDGLVYDATAQKWENVPIMTQAMQRKLGATNLAPNDATTQVISGVTFSIDKTNSDTNGIITLSGTSSEAITLVLGKFKVPIGSYVLSSKADGSKARVTIEAYNGNTWKGLLASTASNDNVSFNANFSDYDTLWMSVRIDSGVNVSGVIIKPMVSVTAGEYAPYAKTNRELTNLPNNLGASVNLTGYTSENNMYEFPCDGYVRYAIRGNQSGTVAVYGNNEDTTGSAYLMFGTSSAINATTTTVLRGSVYVRKGMKAFCSGTIASADFIPLK